MAKYHTANCPLLSKISGLALATILFAGALVAPVSFAGAAPGNGQGKELPRPFLNLQSFVVDSSKLDPKASDESDGTLDGEVQEFSSAAVVSTSSTTKFAGTIQIVPSSATNATLAITQAIETLDSLPDDFDIKNLGVQLSEAAKLHKLLAHEPIETKREFQALFHEFKNKLKDHLGIGNEKSNTLPSKILENEMDKAELQLKMKIAKMEKEEQDKERINEAIKLVKKREKLQEIRNEIGITKLSHGLPNKDKKLAELYEKELELLKEVLISEKKHDNGKAKVVKSANELGKKEIEQIENEAKSKSSKSQENTGQGNGGSNGKGSSGDNPGKGNDKGNKGSSGKGKGKK